MRSFLFNDTANTEIYTLSYTTLFRSQAVRKGERRQNHRDMGHRGAKIPGDDGEQRIDNTGAGGGEKSSRRQQTQDRKSTRLNSSHSSISYAVFCLKKKKKTKKMKLTT